MKNALIIHGCCSKEEYYDDTYPSLSNSHWLPWLQKQLLIKDILTQTPEMPDASGPPTYNAWKKEFEQYDITNETLLIGHSCGGGFLLRWLGENDTSADKLVLVAPWMEFNNERSGFLVFEPNPQVAERVNEAHVLISDDEDNEGVMTAVKLITTTLPTAKLHQFSGKGHFTKGEMDSVEFPELLQILLS